MLYSVRRFLLTSFWMAILAFIVACAPQQGASQPGADPPATSAISSETTVDMPPTQTSCPPQGKGRPVVMAPLKGGPNQNIVYILNTKSSSELRRFDVNRGQTSTLVTLSHASISDAQVSQDGRSVLFLSQVGGQPAIQMIRLDGKGLQTLYCGSARNGIPPHISNLVWSPRGQQAIFLEPNPGAGPGAPLVQVLNLSSGTVQTEITPTNRSGYLPRAWLNETEMYMTGYYTNQAAPPHDVYILDLSKGPNEENNTKKVALIQGYNWDFNLTADGKQLILSQSGGDPSSDLSSAPGLISTQSVAGGTLKVIYASHVHTVTHVRAINDTSLLFIIGNKYGTESAPYDTNLSPGLWKINLDGTELTQLTRDGRFLSDIHTNWSSVSRDGKLYAVGGYDYTGGAQPVVKLFYGSLKGGGTNQFAITNAGEDAQIVGWTNLS